MPDETTIGEITRRMDRLEQQVDRRFTEQDSRCTQRAASHVDAQLYAAEKAHLVNRLDEQGSDVKAIEARMTWMARAAITGLIFPIILLIVGGILVVRGG